MSWSQGGTAWPIAALLIRSRIVSSTDLKLFSLALRRATRLRPSYASTPLLTSAWYCAGSRSTLNVRVSPTGPVLRVSGRIGSVSTTPSSSISSTTSAPRTRFTPYRSQKSSSTSVGIGPSVFPIPPLRPGVASFFAFVAVGASMANKKTTSCSRKASHSSRITPSKFCKLIEISAMTFDGTRSPRFGFPTSVTVNLVRVVAILAQPEK
mmetsp:Transcript_59538/g.81346  ORF Transcript_59538/g.81346 Transcript_59538/m.81346 type:complete len:209 (+) Transcript_59538:2622-3248(+)